MLSGDVFPRQTAVGGFFRAYAPPRPQRKKRTTPSLCQTELKGWCIQLSFPASSGQFPNFEAVIDCAACRERQASFSRFGEYAGSEGAFAVVDEYFD